MSGLPLCTAPFTSLVIDTHKGVRPCCTWDDVYFGNLTDEPLLDILRGKQWKELQEAHLRHEWPHGCINCKEREEATGWSLRQSYLDKHSALNRTAGCYFSDSWHEGVTYLELNSTNICNLACIHCTGAFSTRWLAEERRLERDGHRFEGHGIGNQDGRRFQTHDVHPPNERLLLNAISSLDVRRLEFINLKGGEPMLNSDVERLLMYLHSRDILPKAVIHVSTNGTHVSERILHWMSRAKRVTVWLSVDGVGGVQEYIRHGRAPIVLIEKTIHKLSRLDNVEFGLCTSVMPYNAFSLDKVYEWWASLALTFPTHRFHPARFSLMITVPRHLSLRCLQDHTRRRLIEFYEQCDEARRYPGEKGFSGLVRNIIRTLKTKDGRNRHSPYADVIAMLKQPYLGDEVHNSFVNYTLTMDEYRGKRVLDIVPELCGEMVIL